MEMKKETLPEKYEMKEVDLDAIEELESAIAPGFLGFGCGCNGINFGMWCG